MLISMMITVAFYFFFLVSYADQTNPFDCEFGFPYIFFVNYGTVIGFRLKYLAVAYIIVDAYEKVSAKLSAVSHSITLPALAHCCVTKQSKRKRECTFHHKWKRRLCEMINAVIISFSTILLL